MPRPIVMEGCAAAVSRRGRHRSWRTINLKAEEPAGRRRRMSRILIYIMGSGPFGR
jgi:hypothetical protein